MRRLFSSLLFIALALTLTLGVRFLYWRSQKIDGLTPPASAPPQAIVPADPPVLLLFGDSRIAEWDPLPDRPYDIAQVGVSGETAIRLAGALPTALASYQPRLVMIEAGGNDAVAAALVGAGARRKALAASIAAFERMATDARKAGAAIVFLRTLPPVRPPFYRRLVYGTRVDAFIADINAALPTIARRHGGTVVDANAILAPDGQMPDRFRRDTVHLTPAAYAALAVLLPPSLPAADQPDDQAG